jgi:hypothetical protein
LDKTIKTPRSLGSDILNPQEFTINRSDMIKKDNQSVTIKTPGLEVISEEKPKIKLIDPTIFKFTIKVTHPFIRTYYNVQITKNNIGAHLRRALYEEIMDDNALIINKNFDIKDIIIQTSINFIEDNDILRESEFLNNERPLYATINMKEPVLKEVLEDVKEEEMDIANVSIRNDALFSSDLDTLPSKLELNKMNKKDLERIKDFTVYNEHGKIVFPGETDITGINLDDIIKIEPNIISIYQNVPIPSKGQKLNKKAIIEVYNILPEVDTPDAMNEFIQDIRLRIKENGEDAEFLNYDVSKGILTFSVEFFKKK